jgi:hypothetical protein
MEGPQAVATARRAAIRTKRNILMVDKVVEVNNRIEWWWREGRRKVSELR